MSEKRKFTEKHHWLKEISENILDKLDYSEFSDAGSDLLHRVNGISLKYGVNVMVYNEASGGIPEQGKIHLCTTIKSANIPSSVIEQILEIEQFFSKDHISIVCYRKPVEMREYA